MKHSEFRQHVADEFGEAYGAHLVASQVIAALDHRTADVALAAGVPPRTVWRALCAHMDVPRERWLGQERPRQAPGPD